MRTRAATMPAKGIRAVSAASGRARGRTCVLRLLAAGRTNSKCSQAEGDTEGGDEADGLVGATLGAARHLATYTHGLGPATLGTARLVAELARKRSRRRFGVRAPAVPPHAQLAHDRKRGCDSVATKAPRNLADGEPAPQSLALAWRPLSSSHAPSEDFSLLLQRLEQLP